MPNTSNHFILTTQQMRQADLFTIKKEGISSRSLMEAAGQAIAKACIQHKLDGGRIVIMTGSGNNGGDGFVAARLLHSKQIPVTLIPLIPLAQLHGEAKYQAEQTLQAGVKIRPATSENDIPKLDAWLKRAVIIVDTILGIGLSRPVSGWLAQAITCINQAYCPILAVDIASGIDSDTGKVLGTAIQAKITLPIAAYKWGHWLQQGVEYSGKVLPPANIGIHSQTMQNMFKQHPSSSRVSCLIQMQQIKAAFPMRSPQSFKQSLGHIWIFGGSVGYTGAPKLAAFSAQAIGAGLTSIACPDKVYEIIAASALEIMVHPQSQAPWQQNANAIVAGPGWGIHHTNEMISLLAYNKPLVLDADALNMLALDSEIKQAVQTRKQVTVLTPHPGEAARLLNLSSKDVQEDRLKAALLLVEKYHCWVVLKGAQTMIVSPDKDIWLNPFGSASLAVAGTGDILSGMIGGLLAQGLEPKQALPTAVGLHGWVGEQSGWYRAGQLPSYIAKKIEQFHNL